MKKYHALLILCVLLILSGNTNTAYGDTPSIQDALAADKGNSGITAIPDNYGDYFYYYKDAEGNLCVSNSIERVNNQIRLAQAAGASSTSENKKASFDEKAVDEFGDEFYDEFDDEFDFDLEEPHESISDPLEPVNRVFAHFNDKLYFWVLKPAATGYKAVVPTPFRKGIKNFLNNLTFPVRFVNCLLQLKIDGAGVELGRFILNSTLGVGGLYDIASDHFEIEEYDEDLGQTLGSYGLGHGFYIHWPFLGPSSLTDTIGTAGDAFLEPLHYLEVKTKYDAAIKSLELINSTSFTLGEIEDLKKAALDPYIASRDAYYQYRQNKIEK